VTAQPPATVATGAGFALTITAETSSGAVDPTFNGTVTLALANNAGGSGTVLGGNLTATAVNGVATFSGLTLNNPGNGYTLVASSNGLASAGAGPFNVTSQPPPPTVITPTLTFAPGSVVVVNGTTYAKSRRPSFIVMATPGATANLILKGTKVIGSRVVGVVVADPGGSATFRLPPGIKLGTYTMTTQASGLSSNVLSFKVAARIPKPKRTPKHKPKTKIKVTHASSVPTKTVIRVQHSAVQAPQVHTSSTSNGHVIDQAVHALVQNPSLFKNKKKGH
jgi:hypothetical protein